MAEYELTVDYENNAEQWWDALREAHPGLVERLEEELPVVVGEDVLALLKELPSWNGGPQHAPHPLIVRGPAQ